MTERERERARRASSVLSIAQLVRDAVLAQGACEVFPEPRESCPNWYWHSRARNRRLSPSTDAGHSSQGSAPPLVRRQLVFDGPRKTSPRSRCVPPAGSFADLNRAEPAQEVRSRSAAQPPQAFGSLAREPGFGAGNDSASGDIDFFFRLRRVAIESEVTALFREQPGR